MSTNKNTMAKMRANTWSGNANDLGRAGINTDGNYYADANTPGATFDHKTGEYITGKASPNGAAVSTLGVAFQNAADKEKSPAAPKQQPAAEPEAKKNTKKSTEKGTEKKEEELDLVEGDEV